MIASNKDDFKRFLAFAISEVVAKFDLRTPGSVTQEHIDHAYKILWVTPGLKLAAEKWTDGIQVEKMLRHDAEERGKKNQKK